METGEAIEDLIILKLALILYTIIKLMQSYLENTETYLPHYLLKNILLINISVEMSPVLDITVRLN